MFLKLLRIALKIDGNASLRRSAKMELNCTNGNVTMYFSRSILSGLLIPRFSDCHHLVFYSEGFVLLLLLLLHNDNGI